MNKTEVFIDLSKLSDEKLGILIAEAKRIAHLDENLLFVTEDYHFMRYYETNEEWIVSDVDSVEGLIEVDFDCICKFMEIEPIN